MAKQLADNRQSKSRAGADTGMGVTQVVNADALQGPRVTRISSRYTPTKRRPDFRKTSPRVRLAA
jgi:hypothetical protein